jgi:hypothetical protein
MLVTGWGLSLDREQLKTGLVNGILAKPFTLDELQSALSQATQNNGFRTAPKARVPANARPQQEKEMRNGDGVNPH